MDNYKAKPEHWQVVEHYSTESRPYACILELRARVEALEAQANHFGDINKMVPPTVATDEELWNIWANRPNRPLSAPAALRAIYNLGIEHGQAGSREVAEPAPVAGGLVERVAAAIHPDRCADPNLYLHEARAAILEVARWLRSELVSRNVAERLERETGRWP